ncbi:MAG: DNA-deoxyinosine glycosylase [Lachnospiraceae bacterium]|nr:DNA-deoxyinosine glycosylase [Lachnospiraceae bacterium]
MKEETTDQVNYEHVTHTFGPVFDRHSKILILGSMPSVKSREQQFYYGHPQNRFWKVLSAVLREAAPDSIEDKKAFLLRNHIALWDVIESCDIIGSSDSSIKNVSGNDMRLILDSAEIEAIYLNGGKAYELFIKYCRPSIQEIEPALVKLPSTSPANAAWKLDRLTEAWRTALALYLQKF